MRVCWQLQELGAFRKRWTSTVWPLQLPTVVSPAVPFPSIEITMQQTLEPFAQQLHSANSRCAASFACGAADQVAQSRANFPAAVPFCNRSKGQARPYGSGAASGQEQGVAANLQASLKKLFCNALSVPHFRTWSWQASG